MDKYIKITFLNILTLHHILFYNFVYGQRYLRYVANPCYNYYGVAKKCTPSNENLAFGRVPVSTSICGSAGASRRYFTRNEDGEFAAHYCSSNTHLPKMMTDGNDSTWWQSENMFYEAIQYPNSVNISLDFGIEVEITDVVIKFQSSRPESMIVMKKSSENHDWIPYQYFSSSCAETYNMPGYIGPNYLQNINGLLKATCLYQYSHIVPLTGGYVVFNPNTFDFNEWATASSIKLVLNRLNTFNDEISGGPQALQSYFYGINNFIVFGKCKCNGHSNICITDKHGKRHCNCEHGTAGQTCNKCKPFYQNRPWQPATDRYANECKECNCNGHSTKCHFNEEQYKKTGHGGVCDDCQNNTSGINCEKCLPGFSFNVDGTECVDIDECHERPGACHGSSCINTIGSYVCNYKCPVGFIFSREALKCIDVDECVEDNVCANGLCINTLGNYECNCDSGYYFSSRSSQCQILQMDPPSSEPVKFLKSPSNQSVSDGKDITFRCQTDPPANLTFWYFNGVHISSSHNPYYGTISLTDGLPNKERQLHVARIGAKNYGEYTCEVVTSSHVTTASAWLSGTSSSQRACSLDFAVTPKDVIVPYKDHIVLKCNSKGGKGKVTVKWHKEDIKGRHGSSKRIRKSDHSSLHILNNGYLFIASARTKHTGKYICEIEDETGCSLKASANVQVYSYINEICGITTHNVTHYKNLLQPPSQLIVDKIKRGEEAPIGSAPWQVSIQHKVEGHLCGGSVINSNWVITAAHCFTSGKEKLAIHNTWLKFGKHTLKSWSKIRGLCPLYETQEEVRQISRRVIHPNFSIMNKDNDFALLKLDEPLEFNDFIRPICLPNSGYGFKHAITPGKSGLVTGWGKSELSSRISNILHEASVPINDFKTCFQSRNTTMTANMFCAGHKSPYFSDACKGDSGGPFSVPIHLVQGNRTIIQWHLAGVISWGPPCRGSPPPTGYGFYANVSRILPWIYQVIGNELTDIL